MLGFALGSAVAQFGWFEEQTPGVTQGRYSPTAGVGYLGLLGAGLFALLAALLALAVDRHSRRP